MNYSSIAPCGLNCDLCSGFQRKKDPCVGCKNEGFKPGYCRSCSIKMCPEKGKDGKKPCYECPKYPCKRMKDLDKRYRTKYGESGLENFATIKEIGIRAFIKTEKEKWKCEKCGNFVCVHRPECLSCGEKNPFFPA